jgi:hypothetical protein
MFSCRPFPASLIIYTYEISVFDTSFQPWRGVFDTNLFDQLDKVWECPAYVLIIGRSVWRQQSVITRRYSWNTAKVGVKHQLIYQSTKGVISKLKDRQYKGQKVEDTNGVNRSRKSKERQHNGQQLKDIKGVNRSCKSKDRHTMANS